MVMVDTVIINNHQHDSLLIDYFLEHTTSLWLYYK
jgi:hypothetical protein